MTSPETQPTRRSPLRALLSTAAAQVVRKVAVSAGSAAVGALGWPVILTVAAILMLVTLVLIVSMLVALSRMSNERNMFNYQCESRLGYSVGNTASLALIPRLATSVPLERTPATTWQTTALQPATTTPPSPTSTTTPATTTPATTTMSSTPNPYASLTIPPTADTKTRACASAVQTGDLVGAPLRSAGTKIGRRAAAIANEQVGVLATPTDGSLAGPTNNAFSAANLIRYAYYQATGGELTLPQNIADQITIGDRVDATAIGPGDLVFFNFTPTDGPTAVMIAITPTLGIDATTVNQPIAVAVLPTGNIIVKRPHAQEVPAR